MYNSTANLCEEKHWRERRRQLLSARGYQEQDNAIVSLPLPSFPPSLDFDPDEFTLPPPYTATADVEKALHTTHPQGTFESDASTLCPTIAFSDALFPKPRYVQESHPVPTRRHVRVIRYVRFTLFTVYRRLFTLVILLNLAGVYVLLQKLRIDTLGILASSNFLLAILVRQDYLVNTLFRTAWLVPWAVPLGLRRVVARVYCYGGIHSGAAVAGTIWWFGFTVAVSWTFIENKSYTLPVIILAWVILIVLLSIILLAFPSLRQRYHNSFELTHRFLGWTSIVLFWIQHILLASHTATSTSTPNITLLIQSPTSWNLTLITLLLIYPWLRLRRWTFTAHALSTHAIRLTFPHPIHKFSCLSISSSPLREWHPFATFPSQSLSANSPATGASMVISDAGDWTRSIIQRTHTATVETPYQEIQMRFWIKSHPKAGVLSLSILFPRVLILTTGSGIGPSLSSLLDRPASQFARLVWSTRAPLATYGADMMKLVYKADPDAVIIDTDGMGRPDLLAVAWSMYRREKYEAVFVLSNEKVVKWVVGGLERRGVPAFGPIWDS